MTFVRHRTIEQTVKMVFLFNERSKIAIFLLNHKLKEIIRKIMVVVE